MQMRKYFISVNNPHFSLSHPRLKNYYSLLRYFLKCHPLLSCCLFSFLHFYKIYQVQLRTETNRSFTITCLLRLFRKIFLFLLFEPNFLPTWAKFGSSSPLFKLVLWISHQQGHYRVPKKYHFHGFNSWNSRN